MNFVSNKALDVFLTPPSYLPIDIEKPYGLNLCKCTRKISTWFFKPDQR